MEVLGQAMADEVFALRATSTHEAPQAQLGPGAAPAQQQTPAALSKPTDAHASEAAADDLHHQADAVIPPGSQLAYSLAATSSNDRKLSQQDGADDAVLAGSAAADPEVQAEADQRESGASSTAGAADQQATEAAGSSHMAAAGRTPPPGVTVLRSNPRFASTPKEPAADAVSPVVGKTGEESAMAEGDTAVCCHRQVVGCIICSQLLMLTALRSSMMKCMSSKCM